MEPDCCLDDATPNSLGGPKAGTESEITEKESSQSTFPNLKPLWGKKVCWNSKMGLKQIHKQEFKMKSTCITKERRWLV